MSTTRLISNIIFLAPESSLFECSFEIGICGLLNDPSADVSWERDSGGTPSDSTGPYQGDGPSQFYMYLEATDERPGNIGR